jgi:hypothetical protein
MKYLLDQAEQECKDGLYVIPVQFKNGVIDKSYKREDEFELLKQIEIFRIKYNIPEDKYEEFQKDIEEIQSMASSVSEMSDILSQ